MRRQVTDRSRAIFVPEFLTTYQLDDYTAIGELDAKEEFFDPGERYCSFGDLNWKHAGTRGLRQTEHGTELGSTPSLGYKSTHISRSGDLTIDGAGKVYGSICISMTGNRALAWRQDALAYDEEEVRKDLEESAKEELPEGVEVKINQVSGLTDYGSPLTVTLDVNGSMGMSTGKRLFHPRLPSSRRAIRPSLSRVSVPTRSICIIPMSSKTTSSCTCHRRWRLNSTPKSAEMTHAPECLVSREL